MTELNVGDLIPCKDADELFKLDCDFRSIGIETEFCYELNGQQGYWLEITGFEQ